MAIRVVINTHVKPEHTDAMLAYWRQKSALCSAEEGNLQYETFRSVIEPGHFALLELRRDKPSFDRGPRARGRDGVEFYFEHRYYQHRNGIWQVADQQLEI
jgi:heme-degrading monooxygenase HmoA